jgi:hypothetical protein
MERNVIPSVVVEKNDKPFESWQKWKLTWDEPLFKGPIVSYFRTKKKALLRADEIKEHFEKTYTSRPAPVV